jgi:hypothetical protein
MSIGVKNAAFEERKSQFASTGLGRTWTWEVEKGT